MGREESEAPRVFTCETVTEAVSVDVITRENLGNEKRRGLGQGPEEP